MSELAALFADLRAELEDARGVDFQAFPGDKRRDLEQQPIVSETISSVSRISSPAKWGRELFSLERPRASAQAGAGARAKGMRSDSLETLETLEKPALAEDCLSSSLSRNLERLEKAGPLPAAPLALDPDARLAFDERAAFLEYECGLPRAEAEAQALAELQLPTSPAPSNAASLSAADGLALWRASLDRLSPDRAPCPDYRLAEWAHVHARALAFLDRFGEQAVALGWTGPRLFGVHPVAGIVRVDACGALVLPTAGDVRAITATEISFGHLTHRSKPGQPESVPVWGFGQ